MNGRSRLRTAMTWACGASSVTLLGLLIASQWTWMTWVSQSRGISIEVAQGGCVIMRPSLYNTPGLEIVIASSAGTSATMNAHWWFRRTPWTFYGPASTLNGKEFDVPLWGPTLL